MNKVVEIVIKGPGKNALGTELVDYLLAQLRQAEGAPVLLVGEGDSFSAGLNLKEVVTFDAASMENFLRKIDTLAETLYTYPGPTVALVNGHAIAGGCVLAICCDYRVARADPRARIGLNELAIGAVFPPRIFAIVRQRLPHRQLNRILLGAELYLPEEALALGMIDEVADDAGQVACRWLDRLANHPAGAYAATKRELTSLAPDPTLDSQYRHMAAHWVNAEIKRRLAEVLKR
jgi:enoyl-CoA hydratase/carnithine racemase